MRQREMSRLDIAIRDWFENTVTFRKDKRSVKELREVLYSIAEAETDDRLSAIRSHRKTARGNEEVILEQCWDKIQTLNKVVLLAVIAASEHPEYKVRDRLRENLSVTLDLRDIAVFFGPLKASGVDKIAYSGALWNLSKLCKKEDIHRLHRENPDGANALLRLILHFTQHGTGVGKIDPEIHKMVLEAPEVVDGMISFSFQRKLTCLNDLTPGEFREVMATPAASLRDGVL